MSHQIAVEKHWKSGLTWCSHQLCGPSLGLWSRSWNNLSPRLFNFRCPCLISGCRRNGETGNESSSQLVLNAKCSYEMEHPSANLPLPEFSPAPFIHHVTWFIHTARYQRSTIAHIQAVITSPRTANFFGAEKSFKANTWDQIYPWCNSIEVTGVLHLREM